MQTNAVTAIELVTADGRLVRADHEHEPELFWALRGGGGNFGVVTAIEFAVLPVRELYAGALFFRSSRPPTSCTRGPSCCRACPRRSPRGPTSCTSRRCRSSPRRSAGARSRSSWPRSSAPRPRARAAAAAAPAALPSSTRSRCSRRPGSATWRWTRATRCPSAAPTPCSTRCRRPRSRTSRGSPARARRSRWSQLRHMGGALSRHAAGRRSPRDAPRRDLRVRPRRRPRRRPRSRASASELGALLGRGRPRTASATTRTSSSSPPDTSGFFDPETWERLRGVKALYDPQDLFKGNHHIPRPLARACSVKS